MLKKLISTAILSSVIGSVSANPELGYMTLNTDRNHFFNATIAIDALPAELADKKLKVKLGSITDFYRHDIEYDKQVGSLRFKVTKDASGKPVIRVRSIREITAEQLQAVVKLYVGRQKVYGIYDFQVTPNKKEHHVSLNLLNSDHKPEEKQRYTKSAKSSTALSSEAISSAVKTSREEAKSVEISSDFQYRVLAGKTISQIAMELLPDYPETSNWQTLMEQLVSINPDAFVNGDINQLKSDAVLNLPARESGPQITSKDTDRVINPEADLMAEELGVETSKNKIEQPSKNYSPKISAKASIDEPLVQPSVEEAKKTLAAIENDGVALSKEHKPEEVIQPGTTTDYELEAEDAGERKSYLVSKGETISLIAIKLYPDYPDQENWTGLMDDLIALNPDAFINGDINQLRAGTELTLPDQTQTNHGAVASNTVDQSAISASEVTGPLSEKQKSTYKIEPKTDTEAPFKEQHFSITRGAAADPIAGDMYSSVSEQPGEVHQVIQGETISGIAMRLFPTYPQAKNWKQLMDQLVTLNPGAFINGDITRLRADTVLTLPERVDVEVEAENFEQPEPVQADAPVNNHEEKTDTPQNTIDEASSSLGSIESDNRIYQVSNGETISAIAMKLTSEYPDSSQWQAIMSRLVALNPEAFIDGDVNRLLANALLILPDRDDFEVEAENQELPEESLATKVTYESVTLVEGTSSTEIGDKYQVSQGESVSSIAIKLAPEYPEALGWQGVMEHLVNLNPEAFIDGNASKLRSDALLALPSKSHFNSEVEAVNHVQPLAADFTEDGGSQTGTYKVAKGESLISISLQILSDYPEAGSVQAIMDQLVSLNPKAFINGDPRRLKAESILTLPSQDDFINQSLTEEVVDITSNNTQAVQQEENSEVNAAMAKLSKESPENQYQVSAGESISAIAMKLLPNYPQTQDWKAVMNSLILLNPGAFIGGDESKLRSDAVLMIPGQDDLEIEAENQEIPETKLPDSSFNNLEKVPGINLALSDVQEDSQSSAKKSEVVYRVSKGESLSVIAFKLLPEYPEFGGWYPLMEELARLNSSVFMHNDIGVIMAGTLLRLPLKDLLQPEDNEAEVHTLQTWDEIAEQRRKEQSRQVLIESSDASYKKISQSLAMRAEPEKVYSVPEGHSISMVAIHLFPDFPEYSSWSELMKVLHELNPDAFIENDINQLRSNAELILPDIIRP